MKESGTFRRSDLPPLRGSNVEDRRHRGLTPPATICRPFGPAIRNSKFAIRNSSGAILLEVILALSLFFVAAGAVTGSLYASIRAAGVVKLSAQAEDLAVTKLSEMQIGMQPVADAGPEPFAQEGDLSKWTWQLATAPVESQIVFQGPPLKRVEIIIRNTSRSFTYRLVQVLAAADEEEEPATEPAGAAP